VAKQPTKSCASLTPGATVLGETGQTCHVCMVNRSLTLTHGIKIYPIKVINSDKVQQAPNNHLKQFAHRTANQQPITEAEKIVGYWHQQLEHLSLICL